MGLDDEDWTPNDLDWISWEDTVFLFMFQFLLLCYQGMVLERFLFPTIDDRFLITGNGIEISLKKHR